MQDISTIPLEEQPKQQTTTRSSQETATKGLYYTQPVAFAHADGTCSNASTRCTQASKFHCSPHSHGAWEKAHSQIEIQYLQLNTYRITGKVIAFCINGL